MESYERKNAREWQVDNNGEPLHDSEDSEGSEDIETPNKVQLRTQGSTPGEDIRSPGPRHITLGLNATAPRTVQTHRDRVLKNTFLVERDSDAKASWRKGRPSTGVYDLPISYDQIDRRKAQVKPGVPVAKPFALLEDIGFKTGAFIQPPKSYSDRRLHIWGNQAQVVAAKKELIGSIKSSQRSSGFDRNNPSFLKVQIISGKKQIMLEKRMEVEAEKQRFRQVPEDRTIFPIHGCFTWPADQIRPDELFGNSVEAFDPVRMAYRCHITFDTERSMFTVLSDQSRPVQEALCRIRTTLRELASRSKRPTRLLLLQPPSLAAVRNEVGLSESQSSISRPRVKPLLVGQAPSGEELAGWAHLSPKLSSANESCIKRAILDSLSSIRFYRGHVRMRVHFGSFVFSVYRKPNGPTHTLEEFMQMMRSTTTTGELIKDLNGGNGEMGGTELISRSHQATELFAPNDVMTTSLEDVQPVFSAMFEIDTAAAEGLLRLEVEFSKVTASGDSEIARKRWIRLDGPNVESGSRGASPPLDLNVVALEGSSSWQIQITTDNSLDETKMAPQTKKFIEGISLDSGSARIRPLAQTQQLVRFPTFLPVRTFIQKTGFRYRLRNSTYLFEIAKYQQFTASGTGLVSQSTNGVVNSTTWGASLLNEEWDMILGQNAHLSIGEVGTWIPSLNTFFPKDINTATPGPDAGFHDFLTEVGKVATLLDPKIT